MKHSGVSDLVVRLMTQVTSCKDLAPPAQGCCCPRMLTAPVLRPGPLLLNAGDCPDIRDQGLGELLHRQRSWHTPTTPPNNRPGSELWQFQLKESDLSRENALRLNQDFSRGKILPFSCL